MAGSLTSGDSNELSRETADADALALGLAVRAALAPLASLKFTVALFAMAIFIVLAGTLAQTDKDIWQVVHEYFRSPVAKIDLQVFFPKAFFPSHPRVPGW